jgi:hypothetical protein
MEIDKYDVKMCLSYFSVDPYNEHFINQKFI